MKLLLLGILAFVTCVEAKRLVLITSVDHEKANLEQKLERIFLKKLRDFDYELIAIHKADQAELHQELTNPRNEAVFWISHGSFARGRGLYQVQGVAPQNLILDYRRDNVAPIFQIIHPNINFLGIIGCNSKQILESYSEVGIESGELQSYVSSRKAIAQFALRKALRRFKRSIKRPDKENVRIKGHPIIVEYSLPYDFDPKDSRSLRIMNNGILIGVIPALNPGESFKGAFTIPEKALFSRAAFNLEFNTGQNIYGDSPISFGSFRLNDQRGNAWTMFSKATGEPFGVNRRVFLYQGDKSILETIESRAL